MGRLDDIVERNRNPKGSFRKAKAPAPRKPETAEVNQPEPGAGEDKGRLDRIIDRNRNPNRSYKWIRVGLAGIVLFVVLILLIFTDLASPPDEAYPARPPATRPTGVDGVKLWRAPKRSGSATK